MPLGLLAFVASLAAAALVLLTRRPLLFLGGLTDEWFPLSYNLAAYGTLGWGDEPILLRPPGYPAFIAALLRLTTDVPARLGPRYTEVATEIICLAQAVLLAATASLIFSWLKGHVGRPIAFGAALFYGLNPYCLLLPGLIHYDVLHLFLLVAGWVALDAALARAGTRALPMAATGALWGITALVRPVTLPLPLLVAVMCAGRGLRGRRAVTATLAFSLGMGAVVAPWTARNYSVSGRFVTVNVQGWTAVWGSTAIPLDMDPNVYQWYTVAAHFLPIYTSVTGEPYDYLGYLKHNAALEAAFKERAIANIRARPGVYAWNVGRGFATLGLQLNTALVSVFQRIQRTGEAVQQAWFWKGAEAERAPTRASRATAAADALVTALAAIGLVAAVRRRNRFLLVPGLVYLCVTGAHAITYVDFNYYYLKLPFAVVFAAGGVHALGRRGLVAGGAVLALALAASAALMAGL